MFSDIEKVKYEVLRAVEMAQNAYPHKTIPMPNIEFSNRMTSAAGKCIVEYPKHIHNPVKFTLKFSLAIMEMNSIDDFLNRVPYHEVAHMVDLIVYGNLGHGPTFFRVMKDTFKRSGDQATRYHSFKTKRRLKTRYVWKCECGQEYNLTQGKHKKYLIGTHIGYCPPCGYENGKLKFTGRIVTI